VITLKGKERKSACAWTLRLTGDDIRMKFDSACDSAPKRLLAGFPGFERP
jgi:hypothetical protein